MKQRLLLLLLICSSGFLYGQEKYTLDSTVLTSRVVKDSLDIPWEILWGPDDHIWMTERFGRVSRLNPETGEHDVLLDLSADVYERSEAGMLGMVLHPDFENTPHVFIAYTYLAGSSILERLVKFDYDGKTLIPIDTLVENIVGNTTHIGCRLLILPDNTLLMTTGDAQKQNLPQDMNSLSGKVLRMNLDGTIPSDNPSSNSYVWSYGHRNAQGLWLAPNGILYSSEHGPTTDDELNIIKKDRNYGWPTVAGFCDSPPEEAFCDENNVVEPLAAWTPTIAPSDIIWYGHRAIPEFRNKLLMTVLKDKSVIAFGFNEAGDSVVSETKYFKNELTRLRDICVSPDGKIYLATSGNAWSNNNPFTHKIIELSNEDYNASVRDYLSSIINIGPNPIQIGESLNVRISNGGTGRFVLSDLVGKIISEQTVNGNSSLNIPAKEGVFIWTVILENGEMLNGKLLMR